MAGLGHPQHSGGDPRADRLLAIADELGVSGKYVETLRILDKHATDIIERPLPINVSGAIPAVILDAGWPLDAAAKPAGHQLHFVRPVFPCVLRMFQVFHASHVFQMISQAFRVLRVLHVALRFPDIIQRFPMFPDVSPVQFMLGSQGVSHG